MALDARSLATTTLGEVQIMRGRWIVRLPTWLGDTIMAVPDRLEQLFAQNQVTAIDFAYVWPNQTTLDVFFLRDPSTLARANVGPVSGGTTVATFVESSI